MSAKHETPVLTTILYVLGAVSILIAFIGGGFICMAESSAEGIAVIGGGIFTGIIYLGIGQIVDYLARTAFSTARLCAMLEASVPARAPAPDTSLSATVIAPATASSKARYYYSVDGEQQGPVEASDLRMMRKDGLITEDAPVLREGEAEWRKFRDYAALNR